MERGSALLIVDVQRDFCPGGRLAVSGGDEIIPVINRYIELFTGKNLPVIATRDWHPPETVHFESSGGEWPVHCVQGTEGAEFHPDLALPDGTMVLSKGMDPEKDDSYSGFNAETANGLKTAEFLRSSGIDKLYVCGIATDYCVRHTVLDALDNGFSVTLLKDAVRGVDRRPGDSGRAIREMDAAGATMAELSSLK